MSVKNLTFTTLFIKYRSYLLKKISLHEQKNNKFYLNFFTLILQVLSGPVILLQFVITNLLFSGEKNEKNCNP
jgi:hypothetical protein